MGDGQCTTTAAAATATGDWQHAGSSAGIPAGVIAGFPPHPARARGLTRLVEVAGAVGVVVKPVLLGLCSGGSLLQLVVLRQLSQQVGVCQVRQVAVHLVRVVRLGQLLPARTSGWLEHADRATSGRVESLHGQWAIADGEGGHGKQAALIGTGQHPLPCGASNTGLLLQQATAWGHIITDP